MSHELIDDSEAWARACAGEGAAFASLFREHQAPVYRRALSLVEEVHEAEDITSAVFFELWRKRRTVTLVQGSVLPWLIVTTLNLARNSRRGTLRHQRLIAALPRTDAVDAAEVAVSNVESQLLSIQLSTALSRLPAVDLALVVLTALDGLSVADAGRTVGLKPGTARMRLHRARERLQAVLPDQRYLLGHHFPEEEPA